MRYTASNPNLIRILIADDSAVVRELLKRVIDAEPDMLVVGTASSGEETLALVEKLRPDLVTMDVCMPRVDGVDATRSIMRTRPTPIAIVTAQPVGDGSETTFRAMSAGAVDVIAKPGDDVFDGPGVARDTFLQQLRNVACVGVVGIRRTVEDPVDLARATDSASDVRRRPSSQPVARSEHSAAILAIGASTGGPPCIAKILKELNPETSPPVVLAQHMSSQFIESFVHWLDGIVPPKVHLAKAGARVQPGNVYVAPGGVHLEVNEQSILLLSNGPPVHFQKPSVDILFESVARVYADEAIGVLLTGMGADGARGLKFMREAGALTIAQDEASSLVYGMPAAARALGAAALSANPEHIARLLRRVRHDISGNTVTSRPSRARSSAPAPNQQGGHHTELALSKEGGVLE